MKDDDSFLEQLLKNAGKRPEPDAETAREVFSATKHAWQEAVQEKKRQQRKRVGGGLAVAAALVLALGFFTTTFKPVGMPVAVIARSSGEVFISGKSASDKIRAGDIVNTGSSGFVVVDLGGKTSLTLAANTSLVIDSGDRLTLRKGKMYFDSQDRAQQVLVQTDWGDIVDIGTQYEVTSGISGMELAVREGEVTMALEGEVHQARADDTKGDILLVTSAKDVDKSEVSTIDARWNWVLPGIKTYNIDGISVFDLLSWTSRTTGKRILYTSDAIKSSAQKTRLSGGEINATLIAETLPLVLETTQFRFEEDEDTLYISND